MGFWSPGVIGPDAGRDGIVIRRVALHASHGNCTLEDGTIRLGFKYVDGFGDQAIAHLVAVRAEGEFTDLTDFYRRVQLPRRLVENLIRVGAMDTWGLPRRQLLWQLGHIQEDSTPLGLIFSR